MFCNVFSDINCFFVQTKALIACIRRKNNCKRQLSEIGNRKSGIGKLKRVNGNQCSERLTRRG